MSLALCNTQEYLSRFKYKISGISTNANKSYDFIDRVNLLLMNSLRLIIVLYSCNFYRMGDAQLNSGVCFFWKIGGKTRGILHAIRSRHIYNARERVIALILEAASSRSPLSQRWRTMSIITTIGMRIHPYIYICRSIDK